MIEDSLFKLRGKSAVVIGGGQGIGEASVRRLAEAGCNVGVLDIDTGRAATVADQARALGVKALPVTADVLDDQSVIDAINACDQEFGGVDVLVTVVGQAGYVPSLDISMETWDLDHQRNLRYVFVAARAFAALRVAAGKPGAIVTTSSVSGLQSAPNHVAYGAAKAGLVNLVKSLADEWAQYGIRVNSVSPGTVETPRRPTNEDWQTRINNSTLPMKYRGTTDDIAKAVLFLASDMAGYVTGDTLLVDGGWMAANLLKRKD